MGPDGRTKTVMLVDAAQQTGKNTAASMKKALSLVACIKPYLTKSANQR